MLNTQISSSSEEIIHKRKFSHIYVEKNIVDHFRTKRILQKFPESKIIFIDHYKDIFNRRHQDYVRQHQSQALILAAREGSNIYEGARVCQSFDNEYFYYTSNVMNCLFDCEYCYLKGMYPSGNMVIFVNIEDTFKEVEELLKQHKVYLCVSYDTDLAALEHITGFLSAWCDFTRDHSDLKIEVRTKCAGMDFYKKLSHCDRVIFAYTLSPEKVAGLYEHGVGSPGARLAAAAYAMDQGFTVRLCFDPMIYCSDWEEEYGRMLDEVFDRIDMTALMDISVGSFRISQEYMKQMRKSLPGSSLVQFPYENKGGVYQYPDRIREQMEGYLIGRLVEHVPKNKIYTWE